MLGQGEKGRIVQCKLSASEMSRKRGGREQRTGDEGPDGFLIVQARGAVQRRANHGAAPYHRWHPRGGADGGWRLSRARERVSRAALVRLTYRSTHA